MNARQPRFRWRRAASLGLATLLVTFAVCPATAMELPPNQRMYAIYGNLFQDHYLYRIDVSTGVAKQIGNTHSRAIAGLTSDENGKLYSWSGEAGLITIDPNTAAVTDVNSQIGSGGFTFLSLDFAPNGKLYAWGSGLYEIDPATGARTFIAGTGLPPGIDPNQAGALGGIEFVGDRLLGLAWSSAPAGCLLMEAPLSNAPSVAIGFTGTPGLISLAQDLNGKLYAMNSDHGSALLVTLNAATGATTDSLVITPDINVSPFYAPNALAIVTVPEPSNAVLLALIFLVQRTREWRR